MPGPSSTLVDEVTRARVALVTCAQLPDLDPDDRLLLDPLTQLGVAVESAVWDDPGVDWAGYDLVVLRSTWDYPPRREEFLAWAAGVPRLANPVGVVAWNTDKRYLADLVAAGVAVVATRWVAPGAAWALPDAGEWVIKPSVGAGSIGTGRYDAADPTHRELASQLVARLHAAGRSVMVQPYLSAVDTAGETSLLFFGGEYSHAIRKGPMLAGPDAELVGLYKEEEVVAREPTPAERAAAAKALAAVPSGDLPRAPDLPRVSDLPRAPDLPRVSDLPRAPDLLYARVDLIPGADGSPVLVELELTEPSVFLATSPGAAARFARVIADRAQEFAPSERRS